jgi:hypothetical protein
VDWLSLVCFGLFLKKATLGRLGTRKSLKASGVGDRCTVIEGNFFASLPCGADTYLFRHIIHDWTDEQSVQILVTAGK